MWCNHNFIGSLWLREMTDEWHCSNKQKRQGCKKCNLVCGFQNFNFENPLQRCKNKSSGNKACNKRVDDNQNSPLQINFIRENITLCMGQNFIQMLVMSVSYTHLRAHETRHDL